MSDPGINTVLKVHNNIINVQLPVHPITPSNPLYSVGITQ